MKNSFKGLGLLSLGILSGCSMTNRLLDTGSAPPMTQVQNPTQLPSYQPVTMPMPHPGKPGVPQSKSNSLWQSGAKAFFKDQRAKNIGDILTVVVNFNQTSTFDEKNSRKRDSKENASLTNFFGVTKDLKKAGLEPPTLMNISSVPETKSEGNIQKTSNINTTLAATVTQVLPNGNLVVWGRQEIRLNNEVKEVQITGVVRPEDITSSNTIPLEKIAEARLSVGGRGQLADLQQPGWGQQIFDIIAPY
ncbi:flagellar basal body L-ring protein FlgH [Candidatus Bealeia paramacronuclearis]